MTRLHILQRFVKLEQLAKVYEDALRCDLARGREEELQRGMRGDFREVGGEKLLEEGVQGEGLRGGKGKNERRKEKV